MDLSHGKLQRRVLAVLREDRQPRAVYQPLSHLGHDHQSLGPITICRALDVLIREGSVRRLRSIKSHAAHRHGGGAHDCTTVICDDRGLVEACDAAGLTHDLSAKSGFAVTRHVVVVHGLCNGCGPAGAIG